jgi:pimeloyl-ACP methyl ester carboxylesterase
MPFEARTSIAVDHVTIHGHNVGYRDAGEGEVIVLIHGMAGSSRSWRDVMPKLAEQYRVIAPDLLGHGESAKPMGDYSLGSHASGLRDLLGVLGVERATVVGQSFGGGVAMQLAYQHPELVDRLVLVSSGGLGREVSWILKALTLPGAEFVMPVIFPGFVRDAGNWVSDRLAGLGVKAPRAAEMWRAYDGLTEVPNRHAFVRTLRSVVDPGGQSINATDRLYLTAEMPTLIVWGNEDPVIPVEHGETAHEAMPNSRLEVFDGVGHFPHAEDPERFIEVLTDFVAMTKPSATDPADFRHLLLGEAG